MTRAQIFEILNEIFQDIFDDETIFLTDETTAADIEDWDSLEHIYLIAAIEQKFSIKFDLKEASNMNSVGEMVSIITNKIN